MKALSILGTSFFLALSAAGCGAEAPDASDEPGTDSSELYSRQYASLRGTTWYGMDVVSVDLATVRGPSNAVLVRPRAKAGRIVYDGLALATPISVGTTMTGRRSDGGTVALRVSAKRVYDDAYSGIHAHLYTMDSPGPLGSRMNLCERPGAGGARYVLALEGVWDAQGRWSPSTTKMTLACSSGALEICALAGYMPWTSDSARKLHQACTRAFRGDYCGDGRAHVANDATWFDLYDDAGVQHLERPDLAFEAAWTDAGATCMSTARWNTILARSPGGITCTNGRRLVAPKPENNWPSPTGPHVCESHDLARLYGPALSYTHSQMAAYVP